MTIAGATYREGVAYSPDGAMYVTNAGGTDVAVADGGTGASTAQAAAQNLGVPYIIAQSGAAVAAPGDTNENTLATIAIPANSMGANGRIKVRAFFTCPSSANNKTFKFVFGGTTISSLVVTTVTQEDMWVEIMNLNATNSQRSSQTMSMTSSALTFANTATAAIDTTQAVNLTITVTKASGGEAVSLIWYYVEAMYKA